MGTDGGTTLDAPDVGSRAHSFDDLYASEYAPTLRVVYALCGAWPVAEEVCQEAFLRALQRWPEVAAMERPDAWLRRVACNLATSRMRRVAIEARALMRLARRAPEHAAPPLPETSERFWALVRTLPARQAAVVALHYADDRAVAEVAEILGVAEGTVKAHLHAARRRLSALLAADEGGVG